MKPINSSLYPHPLQILQKWSVVSGEPIPGEVTIEVQVAS